MLSRCRTVKVQCCDSKSKRVAARIDVVKEDARTLYERRVASLLLLDNALRSIFADEDEARKKLLEKWAALAKEDAETLKKSCKRHCKMEKPTVSSTPEPSKDIKPASEAFYEPWVIDD